MRERGRDAREGPARSGSLLKAVLLVLAFGSFTTSCSRGVVQLNGSTSPVVIAHRGFSHVAPENTLVAYTRAIEAGATWAECDIYLSQDGVPVLMHDEDLKRTTDGMGPVEETPLPRLRDLDSGSWKGAEYAGERIPTLLEFLEHVRGKLRPVIEIKSKKPEILPRVIAAVEQAGLRPRDVTIFCFQFQQVRDILRLPGGEDLPATWLLDDVPESAREQEQIIDRALEAGFTALGCSYKKIRRDFVHRVHEAELPLYVWTVNRIPEMHHLIDLGVDAIITDRPDVALEVVESRKEP